MEEEDRWEGFMRTYKILFSGADVIWNTTAWKHWGQSSYPRVLCQCLEVTFSQRLASVSALLYRLILAGCSIFSSFFFVRVNIRVHVGHWRNLEFQLVTAVTYSAVSENSRALCGKSGLTHFSERIPGRLVKPTGLISQNNVCVWVLVWLPLGKSHSLIPRQLSKGAQAPIDCISGLSSWLSSLLISLCSVDLHSLESPDYFDPRATQSTILGVWVESCPWDCHRNMPLGWQGGSLSCLICQLHPSLLFGDPHQEIIQMKWCK